MAAPPGAGCELQEHPPQHPAPPALPLQPGASVPPCQLRDEPHAAQPQPGGLTAAGALAGSRHHRA